MKECKSLVGQVSPNTRRRTNIHVVVKTNLKYTEKLSLIQKCPITTKGIGTENHQTIIISLNMSRICLIKLQSWPEIVQNAHMTKLIITGLLIHVLLN